MGATVRRRGGAWTPAVHALLRHLEEVGFEGAPRVLGFDDTGREVLSYLPSERTWPYSDEVLVSTARLVRRLHDAVAGFTPPPDATWRITWAGPEPQPVGHNDIGPANTVYRNGEPYGFIDWELAGPAPPLYDLAWAAINSVPLRPDRFCDAVGFAEPPDRPARLRQFCTAYGLDNPLALVDAVEGFERQALHQMLELGGAGVSPHSRFLALGEDRFLRWDLDWFVANRQRLEDAVS